MVRVKKEFHCPLYFPFCKQELVSLLQDVLYFLGLAEYDLEVLFTDDQVQSRLNKEFLGLVGPTNVLSFPVGEDAGFDGFGMSCACGQLDGFPSDMLLGSLSLSVQTWLREGSLYGQPLGAYLLRLLAHGLLHLAGLEHGPEMFELTDQVVDRFALDLEGDFVHSPFTNL